MKREPTIKLFRGGSVKGRQSIPEKGQTSPTYVVRTKFLYLILIAV